MEKCYLRGERMKKLSIVSEKGQRSTAGESFPTVLKHLQNNKGLEVRDLLLREWDILLQQKSEGDTYQMCLHIGRLLEFFQKNRIKNDPRGSAAASLYMCVFVCTIHDVSWRGAHYITASVFLFFFFFPPSYSGLSVTAGHNEVAHQNCPLEGFQKLLTKKVKGL